MIKRYIAIMFVIACLGIPPMVAQDKSTKDVAGKVEGVPSNLKDYNERAQEAADVIKEAMGIPETGIPQELMSRARGIAVIPHMVKGAFGIGGRYGKGLVSQRLSNGRWSTPAFVEIGGGSFGLQLGVEATDLILVFTNDSGLDSLIKGKLKLGADASVAAGPVGRKAEVGTDVLLKSPIFAYSRSKGLFAGISLDGSVLSIDESANAKVYGKTVDARDVLLRGKIQPNAVVRPFVDALERYAPAAKQTTRK
jgi:lipid-binding SYLF domain-containing protein